MCGIVGLKKISWSSDRLHKVCLRMSNSLAYRGPDAEGYYVAQDHKVAFGHRRLSIVDLSKAGAQPMVSRNKRYLLVYNGEIYNTDELKRQEQLTDFKWRGYSDTEAILESIAAVGLEATLVKMNGMFVLALWDLETQQLTVARDRLGIKPLFYYAKGTDWAFSSELKALKIAGVPLEIEPESVGSFLRYGYVPTPASIYRDIRKLAPGEYITISADGTIDRKTFASIAELAHSKLSNRFDGSDAEATDALEDILMESVASQMEADVELGTFLSGGIDSSTVAAIMAKVDSRAGGKGVRTYSIGFPELGFDESESAAAVAKHLGTQHHSLTLTGDQALDVVPSLPEMFDEPFADSSQIPTYLLSKITREHVTVSLSGDGGDELFGGYNRYLFATKHWTRLAMMPKPLQSLLAGGLNQVPAWFMTAIEKNVPGAPPQLGSKLSKFASVLGMTEEQIYRTLTSQIQDPLAFTHSEIQTSFSADQRLSFLDNMRLADLQNYLPDDVLQKVDRCSMANSLEARPVLIDQRLLEFAWTLPENLLIRDGQTKWLLRQVLKKHVPTALFERPKMGFGIPLDQWLRGPLKSWAQDVLDDPQCGGGHLKMEAALRLFADHQTGKVDHGHALWNILSFATWHRCWHQ
ncbi:MAG: asparagine synthase (glutamine-hydrolyzing) [Rhizobiaceae bacterium]